MKPENPSPRKTVAGRGKSNVGTPHLPMEWMDPMSWRLPSGKDLAEFALQAGFLAPLMLERPNLKRRKVIAQAPASAVVERQAREAPEHSGTFRRIQW